MRNVIIAARSNSDKNIKQTICEQLKPYLNDPDIYISLTSVEKIGLNPKSQYDTPLGVYCYPLNVVWEQYNLDKSEDLTALPYVSKNPHVWVLRAKNKIINMSSSDYNRQNMLKDNILIEKIYKDFYEQLMWEALSNTNIHGEEFVEQWKTKFYNSVNSRWERIFKESQETARKPTAICKFWNLSRLISFEMAKAVKGVGAVKWNWLLRKCGYHGFVDTTGQGYIHPNEPFQAVFLEKTDFTIVEKLLNKDYRTGITKQAIIITEMEDIIRLLDSFTEKQKAKSIPFDADIRIFSWLCSLKTDKDIRKLRGIDFKSTDQTKIWESCDKYDYKILLDFCLKRATHKAFWTETILPLIHEKYKEFSEYYRK